MNPVYPVTTLISFVGLLSHFGLPAAIGLHVNGDALYKGINLPVHQLNYNAIPREFIGRIRALSDGLIYAVGLTLAGTLLWIGETRLSLVQIAWLVTGLTVVLLLVRLPMGSYYASGLEEMIRSDSLDLDEFDLYPIQLTPQSATAIKELLTDSDRYSQLKGLELAARMDQPGQFLAEVEPLVTTARTDVQSGHLLDTQSGDLLDGQPDNQVYEQAIALFSASPPALKENFKTKLQNPALRAFALEVLLINQFVPDAEEIQAWLADQREDIRILGAIAYLLTNSAENSAAKDPAYTWPNPLTPNAARIITRVVAYGKDPRLASLIPNVVLTQTSPDIIRTGLEALLPLTSSGDEATASMAHSKLSHYDPMVKIVALDLLRITCCDQWLPAIGQRLGDDDPRVRERAAKALAAYGRLGVDIAKANLIDTRSEVVNAAITAIGLVRSRYASNVLFDYLAPSYALLAETRRWQTQIPAHAPNWQALKVAIGDYHNRLIQKVLYILSALGHARTVNAVNRLLATNAQTELENAIEVLASLNHRRFVVPLMPLLEALVSPELKGTDEKSGEETREKETSDKTISEITPLWLKTKGYRMLLEALESNDRWIKSGALIALAMVPAALVNEPDPFVKQVASQIFETSLPANTAMNRLLISKNRFSVQKPLTR